MAVYLNSKGQASLDPWVDDERALIRSDKTRRLYVVGSHAVDDVDLGLGASHFAGGGGQWATWSMRDGLRHSRGGHMQNAVGKAMGRDGTLALCPNQHGRGLNFIALQDDDCHSRRFMSLDIAPQDVSVLKWGHAVWVDAPTLQLHAMINGRVFPVAAPDNTIVRFPRLVEVDDEFWVVYQTVDFEPTIILQPVTQDHGIAFASIGRVDALDAVGVGNNIEVAMVQGGDVIRATFNTRTFIGSHDETFVGLPFTGRQFVLLRLSRNLAAA